MKGKRLYLIVLLILITTSLAAASGGQYFAASSSLSYYLGITHFEDEIPARSSLAVSTTIGFLGYKGSNWETVLQAHLYSVSDSLPFGTIVLVDSTLLDSASLQVGHSVIDSHFSSKVGVK